LGKEKTYLGLSVNIILLGIVSFLTDTSSEIIMPILPLYITVLGGAGFALGLIGGLGDSVSSILKVFSGYWSDKLGRRKIFVYSGYAASAVSKLFFPLSTIWQHIAILRPLERVGKGLRTAPRDALIAEYSRETARGKAFGLHRAMDTSGAVLGSILALVLFWFLNFNLRLILFIAALIAFLALVPLIFVKERKTEPRKTSLLISLKALPNKLRLFILVAAIFTLGNFTYMLFIERAKQLLIGQLFTEREAFALAILLYVWFNIIYAFFSYPLGVLSDKIGKKNIIFTGYLIFSITCLGFTYATSLTILFLFFALYGLSNAFIDATQRAFTSELAGEEYRGTALGTYHTVIGISTLPAGIVAGILWQYVSPSTAFMYGASLSLFAALLLVVLIR